MPLEISRQSFRALGERKRITGRSGIRQIENFAQITQSSRGWLQSIISGIKGFLVNIGGFLANLLQLSATKIVEWFIEARNFLYEFNWDISDAQIDQQIQGLFNSIQTRAFGILGKNLGSLTAVGLGGAIAFYINPMLAKLLVTQIADDLFVALVNDMTSLLTQMGQSAVTAGFLATYKSARQFIKKAYKNPRIRALAKKVGISGKAIDSWGDKDVKDWSIAAQEERIIENIKDEQLKNNIREFVDEFKGSFDDTALSMANIWDAMQLNQVSQSEVMVYQPDRSQSEQFYLYGDANTMANQIVAINAQTEALNNRDIGQYVVTEDDRPIINNNGILVELVFYSILDTPWGTENRKKLVLHRPRIPNLDRSKLTWENLERLFKPSAFIDGDVKMQVELDNGRKLVCRGANKNECKQMMEKLSFFTEANIVGTPEFSEKEGTPNHRWKPRKKQPMYLNHFFVRNFPRATKYENLGLTNEAKQSISHRFNFQNKTKPVNFDLLLGEALKTTIS